MPKITAKLIENYDPSKNFQISDFLSIFLGQPWLVQEALDDVKLEEDLKSKELELDALNTEIEAFRKHTDERQERLFILDTLKVELRKKESELKVSEKLEESRLEAGQPNLKKVDDLSSSIQIEKDKIGAKRYILSNQWILCDVIF